MRIRERNGSVLYPELTSQVLISSPCTLEARTPAMRPEPRRRSIEDIVQPNYDGLPAAASVEQAIVLAQLLILRDLERRAERPREEMGKAEADLRAA